MGKMAEFISMNATKIDGESVKRGTEVKIFSSGDQLVARADGRAVAWVSNKYEAILRSEHDKRCVVTGTVGDTVAISLMIPELRVKYRSDFYGSNGAIRLIGDEISYTEDADSPAVQWETKGIVGVTARVESGQELNSRVTVTRMLLVGALAFALRKESGGEKFLTVEGPDFLWAVQLPNKRANEAMSFVSLINAAAKEAVTVDFTGIEGLAQQDGKSHVAVISIAAPAAISAGIQIETSKELDHYLEQFVNAGYVIEDTMPFASPQSLNVLVTYH